jgi:hypothetical protein
MKRGLSQVNQLRRLAMKLRSFAVIEVDIDSVQHRLLEEFISHNVHGSRGIDAQANGVGANPHNCDGNVLADQNFLSGLS